MNILAYGCPKKENNHYETVIVKKIFSPFTAKEEGLSPPFIPVLKLFW